MLLEADCRHICSGEGYGQQQGPGTTVGTLADAGLWLLLDTPVVSGSPNWHMADGRGHLPMPMGMMHVTVEASDGC